MNKPDLFQNSSAHPLEFQLVSYGDHVTPVYGASPTVGISKNGAAWIVPTGAVSEQTIAAPAAPNPTTATTGGTVAANTYDGVVTYTNAVGETIGSSQFSVTTTGSTSTITIPSPAAPAPAANGWKAYIGIASGGPYYLQGGVNAIGTNLTLTATPATFGANPPTTNTTSAGWYQVAANATDSNTLGMLKLHATASGADPIDATYNVVAVNSDIAYAPNVAAGASGGMPIGDASGRVAVQVGTGAGQINSSGGKIPATLDPADVAGTPTGVVSGTPGASSFQGAGTLSATSGAYANSYLRFEAGSVNAGLALPITSYAGSTKTFGFSVTWPVIPSAGDAFVILGSHVP